MTALEEWSDGTMDQVWYDIPLDLAENICNRLVKVRHVPKMFKAELLMHAAWMQLKLHDKKDMNYEWFRTKMELHKEFTERRNEHHMLVMYEYI